MQPKVIAGAVALCVSVTGAGAAVAATRSAAPPKHATVKAVQKIQFKINRFVKDELRWNRDVYRVKSGGTLRVVNKANDGPHSFSVVKKRDEPRTVKQVNDCKICQLVGQQHGADPNSEGPPTHLWVEDGVGQDTPASFNKPGDSAFVGGDPGASVAFIVTAKKGTTLNFMCVIHPWMQAKVIVG
jgi:hypothetical protein